MPHNISCKIYFPPVALGQDINMQFFLTNTGQQEYPGGVAEVHKGDYFQYSSATVPKIASGREVKIAMKIPVYEVKSVHKIPSDITLTLSEGFSKKNHHFQIEFGKYAAGLLHYKKPSQEPLVVLCCGMQGATKSSFITSTYKMIKRDAKAKAAIEGAHYGATTTDLQAYCSLDFPYVLFLDIWGETLCNYRKGEFTDVLENKLSIGHHMTQGAAPEHMANKPGIPDCVIFFITVQSIDERHWTDRLAQRISDANDHGIPYVVALTKVDEVDPNLALNPDAKSETLDAYKTKLAKIIGMNTGLIDHVVNYHFQPNEEPALNFNRDRHNYLILDKVCSSAVGHATTSKSKYTVTYV